MEILPDDALQRYLRVPAAIRGRLLVAYSGGPDSTALLHALAAGSGGGRVHAVHVHHGLQPAADDWAAQCTGMGATLGVPVEVLHVNVAADDPAGPEAAARRARYAALQQRLGAGDALVTAHHRDDQAETVLLRLFRGTGPDGLAGMAQLRRFAPGWLWRPLLAVSREQLRSYLDRHRLRWVEDPHNAVLRHARVWLRRCVLPAVVERFPEAAAAMARAAACCAQQDAAFALMLAERLRRIDRGATLELKGLSAEPALLRPWLLRAWLVSRGLPMPSTARLQRIDTELLGARRDGQPSIRLGVHELRRYRDRLYVCAPEPAPPADWSARWTVGRRFSLPEGLGALTAEGPPPVALTVRFARPGERVRRNGRHRSLKNLFQEAGVPPWLRRRLPVLCVNGEPAWVAGIFVADPWTVLRRAHGWSCRWSAPPWAGVALSAVDGGGRALDIDWAPG